jgi:hypothetical protein
MTQQLPGGSFEFRSSRSCTEGCGGACVEVAVNVPGIIGVRDSKTGTTMTFSPQEWTEFLDGVRGGEFDPAVA